MCRSLFGSRITADSAASCCRVSAVTVAAASSPAFAALFLRIGDVDDHETPALVVVTTSTAAGALEGRVVAAESES